MKRMKSRNVAVRNVIPMWFMILACFSLQVGAAAEDSCPAADGTDCPGFTLDPEKSMMDYLNPKIFENETTLEAIGESIAAGELVILKDAFLPEFAESMHSDLLKANFKLQESYNTDGFHYKHHNVYDFGDYSDLMNQTSAMFNKKKTKEFMTSVSGRDCMGDTIASASYYAPGDHSLPHTDHGGLRTVAFVWHLSKNWAPEWGGSLYWCNEHHEHAFNHASFNTLVLFSVSVHTVHFVTTVSPHAEEKRLAFNGWWHSNWNPKIEDNLEEMLASFEQRRLVTFGQFQKLKKIMKRDDLDPERRAKLQPFYDEIKEELLPHEALATLIV